MGRPPLKLMQTSQPLPPTKVEPVEHIIDNERTLGEGEYRSLQLELLKSAEEERGEGKESASFPLTYSTLRRLGARKQLHQQITKKREMISPPNQKETDHEKGPAWRELQQKVHTLEHVYNQECLLKVHSLCAYIHVSNYSSC